MTTLNRRRFLQSSALVTGGLMLGPTARVLGANDRFRVAVAGLNNRGGAHISGLLRQDNVEIAALVDPDRRVLGRKTADLEKRTGAAPTGYTDFRQMLEDDSIDAVSIATPNHWHSLMTIWGAQAGKHVYVEKPMSHDVAEGRVAVEAQKKYGVVVQHGTQRRSGAEEAGLAQAIKAGQFGRLKIAYGYCCKPREGIGQKGSQTPPDHLDWEQWRGPAMLDAYHGNLVHYNWHWFWETGNGDLNNQGTHQLDVAQWAIDDDQTHPVKAMAIGGRFQWNDQGKTPNTMFAMAEYSNGQQVFFNVRNVNYRGYQRQVENEYYFEDGGKIVKDKYYPQGSSQGEPVRVEPGRVTPGGTFGSFVNACRAGDPSMSNATALDAHYSCVLGHLMNNSYRLGTDAPFNKQAGRFGDNAAAAEHFGILHDVMAQGVGVPEDGNTYTVGPMLTFDPETERFTGEHAEAANRLLKDENHEGFVVPNPKHV
ncbi:MAG: Gfo/Idh/MocA family oxidoreductase [Planctomycetota bacterium]